MKFSEISIFASVFSDLQKQLPGLVPPLGLAIAQLAGFDMKCTKPLDLDLTLPQQTHFFQSKLYSSFLRERLSVRLGETKGNVKASATDRLSEIKLLLSDDLLPAEEKAGLEIMASVFGNADFATKLLFLSEKPERFDVVRAWCPENDLLQYQCLTDKAFSWKEVSAQKCMALLHHVSPHKALLPCIANPIVKHLLGLVAKMMLVVEGLAEDFRGPAVAWLTRAVADVASQKLELEGDYTCEAGGSDSALDGVVQTANFIWL